MNYAIDREITPLGQVRNPIGDRGNRDRARRPFPNPDESDDSSKPGGRDAESEGLRRDGERDSRIPRTGPESSRKPVVVERPRKREDDGGRARIDIHVAALDTAVRFLPTRQKPHVGRSRAATH